MGVLHTCLRPSDKKRDIKNSETIIPGGTNAEIEDSEKIIAASVNAGTEEDETIIPGTSNAGTEDSEIIGGSNNPGIGDNVFRKIVKTAFKNCYICHSYKFEQDIFCDPILLFQIYKNYFYSELKDVFQESDRERHYKKTYCNIIIKTEKQTLREDASSEEETFVFTLPMREMNINNLQSILNEWEEYVHSQLPEKLQNLAGSGQIVKRTEEINFFFLRKTRLNCPGGECFEYPKNLRGKKSIFNPSGILNMCLIQCLAAHRIFQLDKARRRRVNVGHTRNRLNNVLHISKYVNWEGVSIPFQWDDISRLEHLNKCSIYVYELEQEKEAEAEWLGEEEEEDEEDCRYSISIVRKGNTKYHQQFVPLLIIKDKPHFFLIRNFDDYMSKFCRFNSCPGVEKPRYCRNCLMPQKNDCIHKTHETQCEIETGIRLHEKGQKLKFKNFHKAHKYTHVGYFDFESLIVPQNQNNHIEGTHHAIASCFIIRDREGCIVSEFTHCGENTTDEFISTLLAEWRRIKRERITFPIDMSEEDERNFQLRLNCQQCHTRFKIARDKTRHHDHLKPSSNYIGAYCSRCNLAARDTRYVQ